jgi:predicted nucleic acid-binding protein
VIVVSDTTPINYLVLIEAIDILPRLFEDVYTAPEVMSELVHSDAPEPVRRWAQQRPEWLNVVAPATRLPSTAGLDAGEAQAISLAKEIKASAILMDEVKGRAVALREGLTVIRTLALIELASREGVILLRPTLEKLQRTTFRLSDDLIQEIIARNPK